MNRRNFLKNSSVAGAAITSLILASGNNTLAEKNNNKEAAILPSSPDNFILNEITIGELQKKMQNGEYTSRTITEMYLKRIGEIDKKGPALNAIIELNPDALAIADKMDLERKGGKVRGLMHGIPVLIKDNINTGDKMNTTAGSLALTGNIASKDAFIIKQLRDAGAVLLGKTNLSEWANFRSTRPTSGWSSRGGQTKNPCVLDRNACGSSSGSGAAVAANLCAVAIGSETDGSVTAPASFCGIVGMKPTVGLLSRSGIIPISKTQDTAGPMARTVKDTAILLGALTGIDNEDSVTNESTGKTYKDYTIFLNANGLRGKRIGIEKDFLKGHEGVVSLYKQAIETLKKQGAVIIEVELLKATKDLGDAEFTMMKYEFKDGLNKYLATANAKVKSLKEVIDFNLKNEAKAMPFFKQEILESSQKLGGLDSKEYKAALAKYHPVMQQHLDKLMKDNKLDAVCGPATGASWCTDLVNGDAWSGYGGYGPAAMAGYPSVTVPMGEVSGLPIGLSFLGRAWDESGLIGLSYAFEQAVKGRTVPKFLKSL